MITISQATETIISEQPFIEELLMEGLINTSALARKILPEVEKKLMKKVKETAVSIALKRMSPNNNLNFLKQTNKMVSMLGEITVRSKLNVYTFENSKTLVDCHEKIINSVSKQKGVFYTYSKGVNETAIVVSNIIKNEIENIFENENLIEKTEKLSSITMQLQKQNKNQVGLYYFILKNIAARGINISEVISTTNEFTIILNDNDIDIAFSAIKKMS